jgi:tetratricopeptide (TPR) repeat protein
MPIAGYILLALMLATALGAQAQEGGDTQARIDYAYQTEDGNSLANVIQNLAAQVKSDAGDTNAHYHLAHAQYRFGQLAHEHDGRAAQAAFARGAEAAFSDCIDELKPVIDKNVRPAEGMVLQSACYSGLADSRMLEAVLLRTRAADRLKSALKLDPRNPRAVFLSAMQEMHHAKSGSPESQRAFSQLQLAAQLFEQSSGTGNDAPGWGHAEAYLALGRELQNRGDHLGARNWIEKALIAAPDYKMAQRQLASLAKP